jgi:hypothetical protein
MRKNPKTIHHMQAAVALAPFEPDLVRSLMRNKRMSGSAEGSVRRIGFASVAADAFGVC